MANGLPFMCVPHTKELTYTGRSIHLEIMVVNIILVRATDRGILTQRIFLNQSAYISIGGFLQAQSSIPMLNPFWGKKCSCDSKKYLFIYLYLLVLPIVPICQSVTCSIITNHPSILIVILENYYVDNVWSKHFTASSSFSQHHLKLHAFGRSSETFAIINTIIIGVPCTGTEIAQFMRILYFHSTTTGSHGLLRFPANHL